VTLVLGRKPGQRIQIGADVLITIVGVRPDGTIRVGIDAPRHIEVVRIDAEASA
jgi:carbon storage regulator